MKLRPLFLLTFLIALSGCTKLPPSEFIGSWKIDVERTCQSIRESSLSEEKKEGYIKAWSTGFSESVVVIHADGKIHDYDYLKGDIRKPPYDQLNIRNISKNELLIQLEHTGPMPIDKPYEPSYMKLLLQGDHLVFEHVNREHFSEYYQRLK